MNLVLFGAPGSGKGTQSAFLIERYAIPQISTGDILRAQRRAGTPLGDRVKGYMDRGELVPDEVMIEIVRERMAQPDTDRGFILDGFPRTVPQAQALDRMLAELGRRIEKVIYLQVGREALVDRLLARGQLSDRPDDDPSVVGRRIDVFLRETAPLVDYYLAQKKLERVDGQPGIEEVRDDILERLNSLNGRRERGS
jgi:adenylate kinase